MRSFYQDRPGTNIGKALKKRATTQVFEPIAKCFLDAGEPAAAASAAMDVNKKAAFFWAVHVAFLMRNDALCQDRLRTGVRNAAETVFETVFLGRASTQHRRSGKETRLFEPFVYKYAHFAKAGSEPT